MSYVNCPKCNEINSESTMYCSSCGESLRGAKVVETANKAYTKSSDVALQKASQGIFECGIYDKQDGAFLDGKLFPGYLN